MAKSKIEPIKTAPPIKLARGGSPKRSTGAKPTVDAKTLGRYLRLSTDFGRQAAKAFKSKSPVLDNDFREWYTPLKLDTATLTEIYKAWNSGWTMQRLEDNPVPEPSKEESEPLVTDVPEFLIQYLTAKAIDRYPKVFKRNVLTMPENVKVTLEKEGKKRDIDDLDLSIPIIASRYNDIVEAGFGPYIYAFLLGIDYDYPKLTEGQDAVANQTQGFLDCFSPTQMNKMLDKFLDLSKKGVYIAGIKSPDLNWIDFAKSYGINQKGAIFTIASQSGMDYKYQAFSTASKEMVFVISHNMGEDLTEVQINSFKEQSISQKESDYAAGINGPYVMIIAKNLLKIHNFFEKLAKGQSNTDFVKNIQFGYDFLSLPSFDSDVDNFLDTLKEKELFNFK